MVEPVIYDAGALVAADRNDERLWQLHATALVEGVPVIVPAPVVAQAWRKPQQVRIARLLKYAEICPMDDALARKVGRLFGETKTFDIVDATVAILAAELHATVLTSDPGDITHLVDQQNALGRVEIVAI